MAHALLNFNIMPILDIPLRYLQNFLDSVTKTKLRKKILFSPKHVKIRMLLLTLF